MASPEVHLVGIYSGGVWVAQRLHQDLSWPSPLGLISSTLHRDDFSQRGLGHANQTQLPFSVDKAHLILIDDVLFTGRTVRAVLNELYDFGRPSRVQLAVLAETGDDAGALVWRMSHGQEHVLMALNTADVEVRVEALPVGAPAGGTLEPAWGMDGMPPPVAVRPDGSATLTVPARDMRVWRWSGPAQAAVPQATAQEGPPRLHWQYLVQ